MRRIRPLPAILLFGSLLAAVAATATHAAPAAVDLGPTPRDGTADLAFATVWEVPAESDDYLLGQPVEAVRDPDGRLVLVDFQQKCLLLFGADGAYLGTLGREGEGPGEMRDARQVFCRDGRFGVLQSFPAAVVWLAADGTPAGRDALGDEDPTGRTFLSTAHAVQDPAGILGWFTKMTFDDAGNREATTWIAPLRPEGGLGPALYHEPDGPSARTETGIDEGRVYDVWLRRWTGDGQGGLWVAPERDRYLLEHWTAAGDCDLMLTRAHEPVTRNEAGRDRIRRWFRRRGWEDEQIEVGDHPPVIQSLRLGDDGDLWVRLDQGGRRPGGDVIGVYDVIGQDGVYRRAVRIHGGEDADWDSRYVVADDLNLVVGTPPDGDEPVIALQRLVPVAAGGAR